MKVESIGEAKVNNLEEWVYTLTYLSQPLTSREYIEMSVRACVGLEIQGMSGRKEIETFIETLGFR